MSDLSSIHKKYTKSLVWFRRDLRDYDHAALYCALKSSQAVYCIFVFDTEILEKIKDKSDRRVEFIWHSVAELKAALQKNDGDLIVLVGHASAVIPEIAINLDVQAVYSHRDYEPDAIKRDATVAEKLALLGIQFHQFKDQVIFEQDEILTQNNTPFSVFTPYKNAWLKTVNDYFLQAYPVDRYARFLAKTENNPALPTLMEIGFQPTNLGQLKLPTGMSGGLQLFEDFKARIHHYAEARNFPAVKGVSYLSVHLRFGTVPIRLLAREALRLANTGANAWLSELIWRDFYFQILYHHPQLAVGKSFKPALNDLAFENNPDWFQAWCAGKTGYPLVDAAIRQLNQTGYMHNRLRMITASFLVKDLLIDWRWGERYFAEKLIDFDFAANNGGWQWAASTGCDAQPWFRIFNPITQSEKFDPQGKFIRKYVPELAHLNDDQIHAPWAAKYHKQSLFNQGVALNYPRPVVDHAIQREQALRLYKNNVKPK